MNTYAYQAVNSAGISSSGIIEVATQNEAVRRIKEMGLFPTRVSEQHRNRTTKTIAARIATPEGGSVRIKLFDQRVKSSEVSVLTRQMATLLDAGLPLIRGLKILQQQESNTTLKRILGEISSTIEAGSLFSEALAAHPKVFNKLYVNMVRAGEAGGALEISLLRLAEFMEKAEKIKGRVKSAMFYPVAVMCVASGVMALMMLFVIPKFKEVFSGLTSGRPLPAFTTFVMSISDVARQHAPIVGLALGVVVITFLIGLRTKLGRFAFDQFKLKMPILGPVFRKSAISRFARTLGTLLNNGVPILQALNIVRETVGNAVLSKLVTAVHDGVKEGENITVPLRASSVFPPMTIGMVDIGEQSGALPDMLLKIADGCDEEVDNAVGAMTSLLEPIMIVFLAIVVGSIVIAMFLPILALVNPDSFGQRPDADA